MDVVFPARRTKPRGWARNTQAFLAVRSGRTENLGRLQLLVFVFGSVEALSHILRGRATTGTVHIRAPASVLGRHRASLLTEEARFAETAALVVCFLLFVTERAPRTLVLYAEVAEVA